jgi:hypothetical protein
VEASMIKMPSAIALKIEIIFLIYVNKKNKLSYPHHQGKFFSVAKIIKLNNCQNTYFETSK